MMEHYSHVLMAAKKAAAGTLGDGNGFRTDDQGKAEARTEAVAEEEDRCHTSARS
jgi:hypothetical protein